MTVAGSDLQLIKRVEGEFFSRFELRNFPFDAQVPSPLVPQSSSALSSSMPGSYMYEAQYALI